MFHSLLLTELCASRDLGVQLWHFQRAHSRYLPAVYSMGVFFTNLDTHQYSSYVISKCPYFTMLILNWVINQSEKMKNQNWNKVLYHFSCRTIFFNPKLCFQTVFNPKLCFQTLMNTTPLFKHLSIQKSALKRLSTQISICNCWWLSIKMSGKVCF